MLIAFRVMWTRRTSLVAAWIAILCCAGVWIALDSLLREDDNPVDGIAAEVDGASSVAVPMEGFKDVLMGKLLLTLVSLDTTGQGRSAFRAQIEPLLLSSAGAVTNLCGAILLARLGEADLALTTVGSLIARVTEDPDLAPAGFVESAALVEQAIQEVQDRDGAMDLTDEQEQTLAKNLGWYGQLIASTAETDPAFESALGRSALGIFISFLVFACVAGIAGISGCIWLVVLAIRWAQNTLANPLAEPSQSGSSLPWILAVWFGLSLLSAVGVAIFASRSDRLSGGLALIVQVVLMFAPLVALTIPLRRSAAGSAAISWSQVCRDVGLHRGRGIWREVGYGFTTYGTAIPMVIVGAAIAFVMSLVLNQEFASASHPIQQAIAEGSLWDRLLLLLLAAVAAPVVEEIVFRGVLFRHLRDISMGWGRGASFVASALGSSLMFAAIHPQGVLFIPILGALAFAFCLARETRGSLISCMVAHGINNGLIVCINIALAS